MTVQVCLVIVIALGAAWMDLLLEKVLNSWIFMAWGIGFCYQLLSAGWQGVSLYIIGALTPLLLLFPLFRFRMLGAGDVKVLSALGGILGFTAILKGIILSFFIGAVFSVAFLTLCGNWMQRLSYLINYLTTYQRTRTIVPYYKKGSREENMHFTVPILLGMMFYAGGFY